MHGSSFTWFQHMAVWGNVVLFYLVNLLLNLVEHSGMYTIMFRLCSQPAYWLSLLVGSFRDSKLVWCSLVGIRPIYYQIYKN